MENNTNNPPDDDLEGDNNTTKQLAARKGKKGRVKRVYDPVTNAGHEIPTEKLSTSAKTQSKEVIKRVNELTTVLSIIATNMSAITVKYSGIRRRRELDMTEVATLARKGLGKNAIATLLGFEACLFSQRKDLEEAFQIGLAELAVVISDRQMELMMTTKGPILPIFLGKNYLGQKDTPDIQVNVQVNNGEDSKEKLASKFLSKSADIAKIEQGAVEQVVDAAFTEVIATPEKVEK